MSIGCLQSGMRRTPAETRWLSAHEEEMKLNRANGKRSRPQRTLITTCIPVVISNEANDLTPLRTACMLLVCSHEHICRVST